MHEVAKPSHPGRAGRAVMWPAATVLLACVLALLGGAGLASSGWASGAFAPPASHADAIDAGRPGAPQARVDAADLPTGAATINGVRETIRIAETAASGSHPAAGSRPFRSTGPCGACRDGRGAAVDATSGKTSLSVQLCTLRI